MTIRKYVCPKCGSREHTIDTISTTGRLLSRIFNFQGKKFTAVICKRCTYTELYKTNSRVIENVFDFISG
jgi:hypothetical protein